jgi:hypothetical protein
MPTERVIVDLDHYPRFKEELNSLSLTPGTVITAAMAESILNNIFDLDVKITGQDRRGLIRMKQTDLVWFKMRWM